LAGTGAGLEGEIRPEWQFHGRSAGSDLRRQLPGLSGRAATGQWGVAVRVLRFHPARRGCFRAVIQRKRGGRTYFKKFFLRICGLAPEWLSSIVIVSSRGKSSVDISMVI